MAALAAVSAPTRAQLGELEQAIRERLQPVPFETIHTFAPGLYIRTVRLPAGAVATGRVHKTEHAFFLTKGEATVAGELGVRRVGPGFQCISAPGTKRAIFCHTDVECSNVHVTTETDLARLEGDLVEPLQAIEHHQAGASAAIYLTSMGAAWLG